MRKIKSNKIIEGFQNLLNYFEYLHSTGNSRPRAIFYYVTDKQDSIAEINKMTDWEINKVKCN